MIHIFHKWGKWEITSEGVEREKDRFIQNSEWYTTAKILYQKRICAVCGIVEFKKTRLGL